MQSLLQISKNIKKTVKNSTNFNYTPQTPEIEGHLLTRVLFAEFSIELTKVEMVIAAKHLIDIKVDNF